MKSTTRVEVTMASFERSLPRRRKQFDFCKRERVRDAESITKTDGFSREFLIAKLNLGEQIDRGTRRSSCNNVALRKNESVGKRGRGCAEYDGGSRVQTFHTWNRRVDDFISHRRAASTCISCATWTDRWRSRTGENRVVICHFATFSAARVFSLRDLRRGRILIDKPIARQSRRPLPIEYRAREQNEGEFYLAGVLPKASYNLGRGESGKVYHWLRSLHTRCLDATSRDISRFSLLVPIQFLHPPER